MLTMKLAQKQTIRSKTYFIGQLFELNITFSSVGAMYFGKYARYLQKTVQIKTIIYQAARLHVVS